MLGREVPNPHIKGRKKCGGYAAVRRLVTSVLNTKRNWSIHEAIRYVRTIPYEDIITMAQHPVFENFYEGDVLDLMRDMDDEFASLAGKKSPFTRRAVA